MNLDWRLSTSSFLLFLLLLLSLASSVWSLGSLVGLLRWSFESIIAWSTVAQREITLAAWSVMHLNWGGLLHFFICCPRALRNLLLLCWLLLLSIVSSPGTLRYLLLPLRLLLLSVISCPGTGWLLLLLLGLLLLLRVVSPTKAEIALSAYIEFSFDWSYQVHDAT